MSESVNLDRIGGTKQSGADVVDVPSSAIKVKLVSGGGGASTIADGADVNSGSTTDAAIVSDANGTLAGKLRGLVKMLADVWDSVNHRIKVDGSGVTQPVSGTFWQAAQPVTDNSGSLTVDQPTGTNLHVVVDAAPTTAVTGTFFQAAQPITDNSGSLTVDQPTGTNLHTVLDSGTLTSITNAVAITAATLPLPTLAATSGNQATEIASLASIDGKITAVNTGAVVISSGTVTSITNPVAVTGAFYPATQPASVADGSDVAEGATTDSAVIGDTAGTIAAKLRGLNAAADALRVQQARISIAQMQQQLAISQAQSPSGFVPITELPAFLGGF